MKHKLYFYSTLAYGAVGIATLVWSVYFFIRDHPFVGAVLVAMSLVSFDNFFCTSRMKKAGLKVHGKYALPPFLKGK